MEKLLTERGMISYPTKFSDKQPKINYELLQSALNINGLSTEKEDSCSSATNEFINVIKKIDNSSVKKKVPPQTKSQEISKNIPVDTSLTLDHDIKQYTRLYHPIKVQPDEKKPLREKLKKLKTLCQKLPFERKTEEVENIFRILKTINILSCQVEDEMLKLLSNIAIYECIEEPGVTIFGNKGLYILLSGSVRPLTFPFLRLIGEPTYKFNQSEKSTEKYENLKYGECFGTLDEITVENEDCSKFLISETTEPCEFLFITTSYYRKTLEKYNSQKHADKLILLKKQEPFTVWPHQALVKIANILTWTNIPPNTLICKEGEISPILGFIQGGSCYVLRNLDIKETLPNGKTVIKSVEVIVGIIERFKSIGEVSLLDRKPMKHSLLSKEKMRVIQADESKFTNLDHDVKSLLRQSLSPEFYHITKEDVESTYIRQKSENDWKTFKETVISDVIISRGIRPGESKWSVLPSENNIY